MKNCATKHKTDFIQKYFKIFITMKIFIYSKIRANVGIHHINVHIFSFNSKINWPDDKLKPSNYKLIILFSFSNK